CVQSCDELVCIVRVHKKDCAIGTKADSPSVNQNGHPIQWSLSSNDRFRPFYTHDLQILPLGHHRRLKLKRPVNPGRGQWFGAPELENELPRANGHELHFGNFGKGGLCRSLRLAAIGMVLLDLPKLLVDPRNDLGAFNSVEVLVQALPMNL